MLYEVAIIEMPTKKEAENGKGETLILAPTPVVAKDDKTAAIIASQKVDLKDKEANRLEVFVRPFVKAS